MPKQLLQLIADKKEQMRSILDKAKAETRNLSDSEKTAFEALSAEVRMAELELRAYNPNPKPQEPTDIAKRFAEEVTNGVREGRGVSFRAIQNEPSIHDASTPILYQDLQKPLEKGLILSRLGGRVLYNVQGEPMWPFVSGIEASVLGENETVGESTLTFTTIKSTPKRISAHIPVSRRAINQSNLDLYSLVMESLGDGVARKLNRIICDTNAHGDYKGAFVTDTMADGTAITRGHATDVTTDDILALEHAVLNTMTDNVGDPVYIMNYKMSQKLRNTEIVKGQKEMLLSFYRDGGVHYGMMLGRRVELSNYVPDGYIYFGDFRYLGLPQYGGIDITVDPYTGAKENKILFTLNTEMDMVKIRKEAFASSKGA